MNKSAAFVVVVVIAFFAIAIAPHITSSDNSDNNVYGIIGAMPEETATLLDTMHDTKCVKIGDREFHIGTLEGKKVVISECGYAKIYATKEEAQAIEPEYILKGNGMQKPEYVAPEAAPSE